MLCRCAQVFLVLQLALATASGDRGVQQHDPQHAQLQTEGKHQAATKAHVQVETDALTRREVLKEVQAAQQPVSAMEKTSVKVTAKAATATAATATAVTESVVHSSAVKVKEDEGVRAAIIRSEGGVEGAAPGAKKEQYEAAKESQLLQVDSQEHFAGALAANPLVGGMMKAGMGAALVKMTGNMDIDPGHNNDYPYMCMCNQGMCQMHPGWRCMPMGAFRSSASLSAAVVIAWAVRAWIWSD